MSMRTRLTTAVGAAMVAIVLAACGSESGTSGSGGSPPEDATSADATAAHNEADTEFAQMMIVHHEGAIEMADLVVERAATAQVRELGERIRAAQAPEIERMTTWLESWGEPLASDADHDGMDHGGMDMGGMDQQQAMTALDNADDADVDRLFLELMIEHHRGAVVMAEAQIADGQNADAIALAHDIIAAQEAEIAEMAQLLEDL